ncbi:unnamed protein product [Blepharisma stoltei]|uniref:Uncharacterized protein n=1 Tax=Blepharisma stoltei TaxID=1481888 RepID=A0AAU9J4D3_9CILI|nr:unnamed protein product [Blepharisma stoltei]
MDEKAHFIKQGLPHEVLDISLRCRRQALLLIIFSIITLIITIANLITYSYHNLYSWIIELFTSLVGIAIGILGLHAVQSQKLHIVKRYKFCIIIYAFYFIASTIATGLLEFISYLMSSNNAAEDGIIGVALGLIIVASIPICWWCSVSAIIYNRNLESYERNPYDAGITIEKVSTEVGGSSLNPIRGSMINI